MNPLSSQICHYIEKRDEPSLLSLLKKEEACKEICTLIKSYGINGLSPQNEMQTDYEFLITTLNKFYPQLSDFIWPHILCERMRVGSICL